MTVAKLLVREQEIGELWEQYQKSHDENIRNQLVLRYERLVRAVVVRMVQQCHMERNMDDLISEGLIALIDAVERFDCSRNVKFATFASIKIRGAVLDFCRKQMPGYSRKISQKTKILREAEDTLTNLYQREPTGAEIAAHLQISIEQYEEERTFVNSINLYSLESILADWGGEYATLDFTDEGIDSNPEFHLNHGDLERELSTRIKELNEEQQIVLSLFYVKDLQINEIAQVLEMEPVRVSQIRYQAVRRLRRTMKQYLED